MPVIPFLRVALAAAPALLLASVASAQEPTRGGTLSMPDSLRARILEQVQAPEGFRVTAFAGPPQVSYPACVAAAATGEVFVCVDRNSSLDQEGGRGRVLRLVDHDGDGEADRYTVFADSVDSPRGVVVDGGTVYVMHPPTLSAFGDTDGDGVADHSRVLVRGLGYDLGFRGADHTTNGIKMGIDGWLYVAVGDYGFVKATGSDGKQLQLRGGGVVRVRPDGSEMELFAEGTRNIYGVALDPLVNVFARDNTNDGEGWNIRLHHLTPGAHAGYPTLFQNFAEETLPPLADYGAGSGTGALWVHDPGFPEPFGNTLYTADWGLGTIFRHPLKARGATFQPEQEVFLTLSRPTDLAMDGSSRMYVASWAGGQFRYSGDNVGYIVRLTHPGTPPATLPDVRRLNGPRLARLLASGSDVHRLYAQREILRRGRDAATARALERLVLERHPVPVRAAAAYTLKQLTGAESHPTLLRAAQDPALRAVALRALTDRLGETQGVPLAPFVAGLSDADPAVQLQAVAGLARLGAGEAADAIFPLTAHPDAALAHTAVQALVQLEAREAALRALDAGEPAVAAGALRVLQRLHDLPTVVALVERASAERDPARRRDLLRALARLYHRDAVWSGNWWGTKPETAGPYYEPVAWQQSSRIRPVLHAALLQAEGDRFAQLAGDLERNRVLPAGAAPVLVATAAEPGLRTAAVDSLLGRPALSQEVVPLLERLVDRGGDLRAAVVRMLAAQREVAPATLGVLERAAVDASLAPELRAEALEGLGRAGGREPAARAAAAFATVNPGPGVDPALEAAWRKFVGDRRRGGEVEQFAGLARDVDPARRVLGYAVLVQAARARTTRDDARAEARRVIDAAWDVRADAEHLVRAIELMNARDDYADRLRAYEQGARTEQ